jgi:putative membrane protein
MAIEVITMLPVLAQMMDRGDMGDAGSGWWWIVGLTVMVTLIVLIVFVVVRLASPSHHAIAAPPPTPRSSAEDLLAERLARGEIDTDEYRRRLGALCSG